MHVRSGCVAGQAHKAGQYVEGCSCVGKAWQGTGTSVLSGCVKIGSVVAALAEQSDSSAMWGSWGGGGSQGGGMGSLRRQWREHTRGGHGRKSRPCRLIGWRAAGRAAPRRHTLLLLLQTLTRLVCASNDLMCRLAVPASQYCRWCLRRGGARGRDGGARAVSRQLHIDRAAVRAPGLQAAPFWAHEREPCDSRLPDWLQWLRIGSCQPTQPAAQPQTHNRLQIIMTGMAGLPTCPAVP